MSSSTTSTTRPPAPCIAGSLNIAGELPDFHFKLPEDARKSLEDAAIQVSLREEGMQIRVGAALFNNNEEIDGFLEITERWA